MGPLSDTNKDSTQVSGHTASPGISQSLDSQLAWESPQSPLLWLILQMRKLRLPQPPRGKAGAFTQSSCLPAQNSAHIGCPQPLVASNSVCPGSQQGQGRPRPGCQTWGPRPCPELSYRVALGKSLNLSMCLGFLICSVRVVTVPLPRVLALPKFAHMKHLGKLAVDSQYPAPERSTCMTPLSVSGLLWGTRALIIAPGLRRLGDEMG